MLRSLTIENVAVIKFAEIEFSGGFMVLTGETGAGKSIIIDSINLLTGSKVSRDLVRTGENSADVSAVFDGLSENVCRLLEEMGISTEDNSVVLRKTLYSDGKSVSRINGKSVTQTMLRDVGHLLVNIHGQNDNRTLTEPDNHIILLDRFAGAELEKPLSEYRAVYEELCDKRAKLESLQHSQAEKMRMKDMLEYQIREIDSMKLKVGEEELLEAESVRLGNLEKITKQSGFAQRALAGDEKGSVVNLLDRASTALKSISNVVPDALAVAEKLTEYRYEISDIADRIESYAEEPEEDPTKLIDKIEARLDGISKLKRKYGNSIAEILEFCKNAKQKLGELDNSEALTEELEADIKLLDKKADTIAEAMTSIRRRYANSVSDETAKELEFLDMPKVKFEISINPCEKNLNGADNVEFLISANVGEPPKPIARIASGGELSRIMLALKCVLSDRDGCGCAIYDEVDTGISGKTARKVGIKLHHVSKETQVLCVTHSAQIASLADKHYYISKAEVGGRTQTSVKILSEGERCDEIARILGGIDITDAQRAAARDMLMKKDL